jgi:hypothetical protein
MRRISLASTLASSRDRPPPPYSLGLHRLRHERPDVHLLGQLELGEQIVLARGGIDLRDVLDIVHDVGGDVVGVAQLAFDEDEDGGHHGRGRLRGRD